MKKPIFLSLVIVGIFALAYLPGCDQSEPAEREESAESEELPSEKPEVVQNDHQDRAEEHDDAPPTEEHDDAPATEEDAPPTEQEEWVEKCDAGEGHHCMDLWLYIFEGNESPDGRSATEIIRPICQGEDAQGCYNVARDVQVDLDDPALAERQEQQLLEMFELTCDEGISRACFHLPG